MSLHCSVPLDEFKGNGTSVFVSLRMLIKQVQSLLTDINYPAVGMLDVVIN